MGYAVRFHNIDPASLSLKLYLDGRIYAGYIAWLMARGGGKSHMAKHVSLARKIVYFLKKHAGSRQERRHADNVDAWLEAMSRQLHVALPKPRRSYVPDWSEVARWAEGLAQEVLKEVKSELEETGSISVELARKNHDALLICLIAGTAAPPLRLWIVKTLAPPEFALESGCQDPDCQHRDRPGGCLGNTVQIVEVEQPNGECDVLTAGASTSYFTFDTFGAPACLK